MELHVGRLTDHVHLGERVVAVAHSGTIDAALRWAVGLDPESPWHHDFTLCTGSITELRCWPRGRAPGGRRAPLRGDRRDRMDRSPRRARRLVEERWR